LLMSVPHISLHHVRDLVRRDGECGFDHREARS
jgi:hypothetical protein